MKVSNPIDYKLSTEEATHPSVPILELGVVLIAVIALLQLAMYIPLFMQLLQKPDLSGVDFLSFYTAGRIAQTGALDRLYNLDVQRAIQSTIVSPTFVPGGVLPYNHAPFLAPVLGLIVQNDYVVSFIRWSACMLGVLSLCALSAIYILRGSIGRWQAYIAIAVSSMLFYPIFISVLKGQDVAIILFGATLWMWALLQQKERVLGLALTFTIIKPHITIFLAIPLLIKHRKALLWFIGAFTGIAVYSLILVGREGVRNYLALLSLSANGDGYGINRAAMYNATGFILRTIPQASPMLVHIAVPIIFLIGAGIVCWLWYKSSLPDVSCIGLTVIICLFCAPHLHFHDVSLLILSILALICVFPLDHWWQRTFAFILPSCCSLYLLITQIMNTWIYGAVYVLMTCLALGLWVLGKRQRSESGVQYASRLV